MRTLIISILCCYQLIAVSQINFENTYNGSAGLSLVNENTYRFYNYDTISKNCVIYNEQHQIIKNIPLSVSSAQFVNSITYLSENLFNNDSKLELVYTTGEWRQINDTYYIYYYTKVINESGEVLLNIPGCQYTSVTNIDSKSKLLAWTYDYSINSYATNTWIYGLPGQYSDTKVLESSNEIYAYPNPCQEYIYLPINESIKTIRIYNQNGQLIDEKETNSSSKNLKYNVNHFSAGMYFFQTVSEKGEGKLTKFIIN